MHKSDLRPIFQRPVLGRLWALFLLVISPVLFPTLCIIMVISEGYLTLFYRGLWCALMPSNKE